MNNRPQFAGTLNIGFTLLEILLVLVLLLLLFGTAVLEFNSMGRGSSLSEGASQLESLFRFARSESERTSRTIRIRFSQNEPFPSPNMNAAIQDRDGSTVESGTSPNQGNLVAEWEPNPLDQPGQFTQLQHSVQFSKEIENLVIVEAVERTDLDTKLAAQISGVATLPEDDSIVNIEPNDLPAVYFYPDGSCDSVKVRLIDRNPDNLNKATVELIGLTGIMRREIIEVLPEQPITQESRVETDPIQSSDILLPNP